MEPSPETNPLIKPVKVFQETSMTPEPTLQKETTFELMNERRPGTPAGRRSQSQYVSRRSANYLLDQRELNELINIDVQSLALQRQLTLGDSPSRKNSDDDYYVEETLYFYVRGMDEEGGSDSPTSPKKTEPQPDPTPVEELRKHLLIEMHSLAPIGPEEGKDSDDEDDEVMEREANILKLMMANEYPDAEIDKLLETFKMSGNFNNDILNGDFIENDIRLSEAIREAIEEVKIVQKAPSNKSGDLEKRKFLQRFMEIADLLGVSLSVEHLLPVILELHRQDSACGNDKGYSKLIYNGLSRLIDFLGASEITVGYNGVRDFVMPILSDFFSPEKTSDTLRQELQPMVLEQLVQATKQLSSEDRTDKVLPIILDSIRDDSDEERRILGLEMVDKLAELLGQEVCQNYLMYEMVSLQDDAVYKVRKETVSRMINISLVLGKEIFLRILFPVFKKLSNDSIWGVRRAAVEMLPQISSISPIEIKNGALIEIFKKFSQDQSKWVKTAAFQFLGPYIATYQGIEPNPILIQYYIAMLEQNKSSAPDNDVPYHCAFNFPAVLLTLGSKSWPQLKPVFESLVKDPRWKVRRTLSFSLHEVAKILGPDLAETELMPVLLLFMKDIDDVKEGVTENLPKFIEVLKPEQRDVFIEKVVTAFGELKDWRKRVHQATQIRQFSKVFGVETVQKHFLPAFFQLCTDEVAEVRLEAVKASRNMMVKLHESEEAFALFRSHILALRHGPKYYIRQTFISMCQSMMKVKEPSSAISIFEQNFLEPFLSLQTDRVVNVRMQLAETLGAHYAAYKDKSLIETRPGLQQMVAVLKADRARDVREAVAAIPQYAEPAQEESKEQ